ncbi:MAG: Asp-tRNA(Asn)/Glu-tRNA(Gln) amidotransferase subunit GatB [Candidatus Daviesbacteria bacterium]|nr:Asp-tRNA(Asn)/Glu-tRNA(Gln) amidotransferase subunit GatB [Candidatus Daviesbacteria bacterium]
MKQMYEPIIGLEVHVELNTKSKMFCRCSADYFGKEPNTYTCPVCLGLPGALPLINKAAIEDCIKIGLALNCKISEKSLFERKNYFYPDLPKGYQISQYRWPLCINGQITLDSGQVIRINRVHQEEDTGKLSHLGGVTLIDFNRSGVPLVEIVTEPDFHDVASVRDYAKKLQQLFRYLEVSNADMERGDMRLEANISVHPIAIASKASPWRLPDYRVELKNINSFRFIVAAIEYEIKRQIEALEKREKLTQETRGWNEDKKCTFLQRSKEEAHDYRYFPEPDLPELRIEESRVKSLESSLPELPWDKLKRFAEEYGISKNDAQILSETKELAEFFESALEHGKKHGVSIKEVANYIVNRKPDISSVLPTQIIEELKGKKVGIIESEKELEKLAEQAVKENANAVLDYKKGKEAALQVLIGGVMKLSLGKADIAKLKPILEKLLKS